MKGLFEAVLNRDVFNVTETVSYTHLDVYKRQSLDYSIKMSGLFLYVKKPLDYGI